MPENPQTKNAVLTALGNNMDDMLLFVNACIMFGVNDQSCCVMGTKHACELKGIGAHGGAASRAIGAIWHGAITGAFTTDK